MDELLGAPLRAVATPGPRAQQGFSPRGRRLLLRRRADAPWSRPSSPGVDIDTVSLEVAGRELVITGERPVAETEGRVYQQVEIEAGPFRRVVELGADVVAERATRELRRRDPAGRAAAGRAR